MMVFTVIVWLAFQGLAVSTLGGMLDMAFSPGDSIAIAVIIVTIGAIITRAMYRRTYFPSSS